MGSALRIVDIVAKAKHIFMKLIDVLESHLHGDSFALPLEINHIMNGVLGFVHVLHKPCDTVRLMKGHCLHSLFPFVLKHDGQFWVQVRCLVQTALHLVLLETGLVKNRVIRQKINGGSRLLCPSFHGKKPVLQGNHGIAPFVFVFINKAVRPDRDGQPCGKCVHHGRSHTVEAAAGLVDGIVKLPARVKGGKHQPFRADSFFMHSHRDSPPVVRDGGRTIPLQRDPDGVTESRQMFVHGIIHNFINQMIEALGGNTSDIHARTFPHGLQTFQHRNAGSVIIICHLVILSRFFVHMSLHTSIFLQHAKARAPGPI